MRLKDLIAKATFMDYTLTEKKYENFIDKEEFQNMTDSNHKFVNVTESIDRNRNFINRTDGNINVLNNTVKDSNFTNCIEVNNN